MDAVRTLPRPKETSNHPIPRNALLPNGTLPRLEPRSPSPLRQLGRRPLETPETLKITTVPVNFTASLLDHLHSPDFAAFQHASNTLAESVSKPLIDAYKDKFNSTPTFGPRASAMWRETDIEGFS
ncbi:hypothetical protein C0992_004320 [Termitomyces sp. T32_za158]|nr:hypothetical protein C0992_004320 [Termitomyces sp. T32_za158]